MFQMTEEALFHCMEGGGAGVGGRGLGVGVLGQVEEARVDTVV